MTVLDSNIDMLYAQQDELERTEGRGSFFCGMLLLACFFYALPFIRSPWGYVTNWRLDDAVLPVFIVAVLLGGNRGHSVTHSAIGRMMAIVVGGLLASYCISWVWPSATTYFRLYGMVEFVRYLQYCIIFFLAARLVLNIRRLQTLMWMVFAGGVFVALYGLAQYYGIISIYYMADMFKEEGIFDELAQVGRFRDVLGPLSANHGYCGSLLGICLAFSWALFSGKGMLGKGVLTAGSLVMLYAMLLSSARAPVYALGLTVFVTLALVRGRLKVAIAVLCAGILAWLVLTQVPEVRDRFFLERGFGESTGGYRVRGWIRMFGWLMSHPLAWVLGVGVGNWQGVLRPATNFNAAHNNYVHFLIEGGLPGLLLFLVALGTALRVSFRLSRSAVSSLALWGRGMFTALVFLTISAVSQENFVPVPAFGSLLGFILFLLGITSWAEQRDREQRELAWLWPEEDYEQGEHL